MKYPQSIKCVVALLGALALVAPQVDAKPGHSGGKGKGKGSANHSEKGKKDKGHTGNAPAYAHGKVTGKRAPNSPSGDARRFRDNERNEILDYFGRYRTQGQGLPPGLAKNQQRGKPLPPGWQKKLVPGYRIEDNLWSGFTPVPSSWFPNVRAEPNTRLYHHGDRVVRVYEPRREILDVITLPSR